MQARLRRRRFRHSRSVLSFLLIGVVSTAPVVSATVLRSSHRHVDGAREILREQRAESDQQPRLQEDSSLLRQLLRVCLREATSHGKLRRARMRSHRRVVPRGEVDCRYMTDASNSRNRSYFDNGTIRVLLFSGRFEFFRRMRIYNAQTIYFVSPPSYPNLWRVIEENKM